MRRIAGYMAFGVGCFLVFLSPLLFFYATPRIEKAPYDVYDTTVSNGSGSYFSARKLAEVGPVTIQNVSVAKGIPERSTHSVAVINLFSRTSDVTNGQDIDYGNDVYAFDRSTGFGVRCCGAKPVARGVTLKFPFDTQKGEYPFWDSTAKKPFPAKFVRTETVAGMTCDVFVSEVPATRLGDITLPGVLVGRPDERSVSAGQYYSATTTLWVEPTTGAILKAGQHSKQWVADASNSQLLQLADVDVLNDDRSVANTADQVNGRLGELRIVSFWLPVLGPIVGILLAAGGILVLRRGDPIAEGADDPVTPGLPVGAAPEGAGQL